MEFYDLKTRKKVDIADADINKMKIPSKSGANIRFALVGNFEGRQLYKFVNEATFNASGAKEVTPPKK